MVNEGPRSITLPCTAREPVMQMEGHLYDPLRHNLLPMKRTPDFTNSAETFILSPRRRCSEPHGSVSHGRTRGAATRSSRTAHRKNPQRFVVFGTSRR